MSNHFQQDIGQFARHGDYRIMARWQLSQTPPRFRWRKCSRRQKVAMLASFQSGVEVRIRASYPPHFVPGSLRLAASGAGDPIHARHIMLPKRQTQLGRVFLNVPHTVYL